MHETGEWLNLVYMYVHVPGNLFEAVSLSKENTVTIMGGQDLADEVMALMNFSTKYNRLV